MKKFTVILLILFASEVFAQKENQFVFLFDNSGSMWSYYRQPQSTFRLFCKTLIKNSVKKDDKADVMLFTFFDPKRGITSPKVLFSGNADALIPEEIMNKFNLMTGNDDRTGTTDLIEAIDKGIAAIKGNTGIIWLITDNINDNSGSGDSSYMNTLEYYKKLRTDSRIQKILLFPITEVLTEGTDTSKGYMAYGKIK